MNKVQTFVMTLSKCLEMCSAHCAHFSAHFYSKGMARLIGNQVLCEPVFLALSSGDIFFLIGAVLTHLFASQKDKIEIEKVHIPYTFSI